MNWDTETDIYKLLEFAKPTNRKLILFSVNCCKEVFHLMKDQRSKDVVLAAELFADNKISKDELQIARNNAWDANTAHAARANAAAYYTSAYYTSAYYTSYSASAAYASAATHAAANTSYSFAVAYAVAYAAANPNSNTIQINILKDIINPFPTTLNPNTLTYNNNLIPKIANSIYNSQNFNELPILADILEDAHEYNPILLNHLRSDQIHYKGCWAIDLLTNY